MKEKTYQISQLLQRDGFSVFLEVIESLSLNKVQQTPAIWIVASSGASNILIHIGDTRIGSLKRYKFYHHDSTKSSKNKQKLKIDLRRLPVWS